MKKKTVITTEKHEVWVIKQPSGVTHEFEEEAIVPNTANDSDPAPNELPPDDDASVDEHE